jgi:hypothetical protein
LNLQIAEICAVSLGVAYLICYVYGWRRREWKRRLTNECIKPALEKQYFSVSDSWTTSFCEIVCYATGRRTSRSCLAKIKLKESQDFLHFIFFDWFQRNEDRIGIKIDFNPEDSLSPIVYMLAQSSFTKMFTDVAPDVKMFTTRMALGYLPKSIVCMTENRECVVLTSRIISAIRHAESIFRCLHISDQMELIEQDPPDRGIVLWTSFPKTTEEQNALHELIVATCELSDLIVEKSDTDLTVYPTTESKQIALAKRMRARFILAKMSDNRTFTLSPVQTADLNEAAAYLKEEQAQLESKKNS